MQKSHPQDDRGEHGLKMVRQWKRPENLFVLDDKEAALIIIDMQNFSCVPSGREPLPRIEIVINFHFNQMSQIESEDLIWYNYI